jgi:hypothetical protein
MGMFAKKQRADEPGQVGDGLEVDLQLRVCPECRRELHLWQQRCPDDGAPAVEAGTLPRSDLPPVPSALLDDDAPGGD